MPFPWAQWRFTKDCIWGNIINEECTTSSSLQMEDILIPELTHFNNNNKLELITSNVGNKPYIHVHVYTCIWLIIADVRGNYITDLVYS